MTVTVTVANSVPAGSLGAAFSSFSASGLFTLTGVEDTLTAHAGGTQAAALALSSTKNYHRISVCATAGDSVALPPATVGQAHFVRNDGAAACQVFGTTPDTIDGVATATGIALPAGVGRWFVCTTAAKWYTDEAATTTGSGANVLATNPTLTTPTFVTPMVGVEDALTAHAGGTKAAALALDATKNYHHITTCATEGDSILLPAAVIGQSHFVRNDGAAPMKVYGAGTDTINGVATATGVQQSNYSGALYECLAAGSWTTVGLVEAGTWTPVLYGSGTAGTYELAASANARYVKNGKQVQINARVITAAAVTAGGTGDVRISGLPFPCSSANYGVPSPLATSGIAFTGSYANIERVTSGETSILYAYGLDNAGAQTAIPISAVGTTDALIFQMTYITA